MTDVNVDPTEQLLARVDQWGEEMTEWTDGIEPAETRFLHLLSSDELWETLTGLAEALRATRTELETARRLLADSEDTLASTMKGYEENERELEAAEATLQQAQQENTCLWEFVHAHDAIEDAITDFTGTRESHNEMARRLSAAREALSSHTDDKDEP